MTNTLGIVAGEDLPAWLAPALAAAGLAAAIVTVVLVTEPSAPPVARRGPESVAPESVGPESAAPESAARPVMDRASPTATATAEAPVARVGACPPIAFGFDFGARSLTPAVRASVEELGAWLVAHPGASVLVHGHADARGRDDANLALSRIRAENVSSALVAAGVTRARMTVRGFGAYQPVEGAPEEAASNRRVVVYVKNTGECPPERPEEADR